MKFDLYSLCERNIGVCLFPKMYTCSSLLWRSLFYIKKCVNDDVSECGACIVCFIGGKDLLSLCEMFVEMFKLDIGIKMCFVPSIPVQSTMST